MAPAEATNRRAGTRGALGRRRVLENLVFFLKLVLFNMHAEKLLLHSFPLLPMTFYSRGLPLNPIFQSFELLIQVGQLSELRSSSLLRESKTLMHLVQESIRKPKPFESFEHSLSVPWGKAVDGGEAAAGEGRGPDLGAGCGRGARIVSPREIP